MKKIKICHVQLLPIMSGVQRAMLEVFEQVDREKYDLFVICREKGDLTCELDMRGIPYILVPRLIRKINPLHDFMALLSITKVFREYRFDIVHTHSTKTGILGRVAARLAGVPHVMHTVQGFSFHEFSRSWTILWHSLVERIGSMLSNQIIFVNNEDREWAIRHRVVNQKKAVTIYNGIRVNTTKLYNNQKNRNEIRRQIGFKDDDFVVGYVGRLWEQKDPKTLLHIIKRCQSTDLKFLVLGDGPYFSNFLDEFKLSQNVKLMGWVAEPMNYYPAIDVLLLPSLWEGLSVTIIEAMSFGKPIIASNIKGNRECVKPNINGYLCPVKDIQAFVDAIRSIAADPVLYNNMSENSIQLSHEYFNAEKNVAKVIEIYDRFSDSTNLTQSMEISS
jgi:glycosyltransferase involved in cell wall biosynthesis